MNTLKRGITGLALLIAGAAGCGGGTEPKETGSLSVTASATPSSLLEGDSLYASGTGAGIEGATLGGVNILAAGQQTGGSGSILKVVPTTSGNVSVMANGTRSQGTAISASATAPYTVTPLVATGTPSATTGVAGQSVTFPYTAPVGTDSAGVVASDGRRFITAGNTGSATIPLLTAGNLTLTPYARNNTITRNGTPATVAVAAAPISLRIISNPLAGGTLGRYLANVGGTVMELPADTTMFRQAGTYAVGVATTDTLTRHFGEMIVGADTMPIAANYRTHNVTLNGNKTVVLNLLTKNNPNFTPEMLQQFNMIWADQFNGTLHPTKLLNWEFYDVVNTPSNPLLATSCAAMTPEQVAASTAAFNRMVREDSANGTARRNFTRRSGDPVAEGKYIQVGGGWRPAPGVVIRCRSPPPDAEDNISRYDAQGFFEAYRFRSGGITEDVVYGELKDFVDMVRNGQEGTRTDLSRNTEFTSLNRGSLDTIVYNSILNVAWVAGQKGYAVLKGPQ